MDLFDLLEMVGGLCLFLFGMTLMGQALDRRAGSGLRTLLRKLADRFSHRSDRHRSDPKLLCNDCYGGGLCQLRSDDLEPGL